MKKHMLITLFAGAVMLCATGCQQGKKVATATPTPAGTVIISPTKAPPEPEPDPYTPTAEEEKKVQKGIALMLEAKPSEALIEFSEILKKNPEMGSRIQAAGKDLMKNDRPEDAIKVFALASAVLPDKASLKADFAMASNLTGQPEKAIDLYTQAIALTPNDHTLFYARAVTFDKIDGRKQEALNDFAKTIELKPDFARAYTRRAILLGKMGQNTQALAELDKALDLDSEDTVARWNRVKIMSEDPSNAADAMKDIELILKIGRPPEVVLEAKMMKVELKKLLR